jgi:peptidoglycan/LPS O-acetylase OafA/YrhL
MSTSARIPSLDGLRAISITMVMLAHLVKWKHISAAIPQSYGTTGVHIFFVLSGFLITSLLMKELEKTGTINVRDFYIRRAYRIFPAAFVFLAIVMVFFWHQVRWYHLAAAVFYAANMDLSRPWMFGHLWSLSIEEQFYLLWPFALRMWYRHRIAILVCVFALTPFFCAALYAFKLHGGIAGSLPVSADKLAIGCLLAMFAPRLPRISRRLGLLMALAILLIPLFPPTSAGRTLFTLFVLKPVLNISIAGFVLHVIQTPYRALNWAPVVWLGKISYSLYLWQQMFCSNPAWHSGYILVVPAIACAALSYYAVEQPMLRLRDRRSRKPVPAPVPALEPTSLSA